MYELEDNKLKIYAKFGVLLVNDEQIEELSLAMLDRISRKWKILVHLLTKDLATVLLHDVRKRKQVYDLLREFGIKKPNNLTISQIEALLFYYNNGPSILFRFHNTFPQVSIPDTREHPIDYGEYLDDMDNIETARLYLLQNNKMELESWPLSRIFKLFNSMAFIQWAADQKNRESLLLIGFEEHVRSTNIEPDEILSLLGGS